ncbi:MAG: hypothetical protein ACREMS_08695 [Gemmatimonadaceae bacterium]
MDDEKMNEKKAAVSAWMQSHGWLVEEFRYEERPMMYFWRSYDFRPIIITLWLTEEFFDDHSAFDIVHILERLRAHEYLQSAPKKFTIIRNSEAGTPEIIQLTELPDGVSS